MILFTLSFFCRFICFLVACTGVFVVGVVVVAVVAAALFLCVFISVVFLFGMLAFCCCVDLVVSGTSHTCVCELAAFDEKSTHSGIAEPYAR